MDVVILLSRKTRESETDDSLSLDWMDIFSQRTEELPLRFGELLRVLVYEYFEHEATRAITIRVD